jgi:hypothetical protein
VRVALLLLLLGACRFGFDAAGDDAQPGDGGDDVGPPPPPFAPNWRNGTRLRAVTLVPIDGGDPIWVKWHDTMLDTTCHLAAAADGIERCVPLDASADEYFSNAGCTTPLGLVRASLCAANHTYAGGRDVMGRAHVYPIGALHTGPIYDARAGCTLATPATTETVYTLGAELPPTMLLASQYHKETIGNFVRPFQGTIDGASIEIGSIETMGAPCYPDAKGLGPTRCQPTQARGEPVYSDAQCLQRAYFWDRQSYDPSSTQTLAVFDAQACETQYRLFQTIADITAPQFYRRTTGGCVSAAMTANGRLYTATEIADLFPLGTIVVGERRGRLGYLSWVGPDGSAMLQRYYDHDLRVPCNPFVAADGKLRCLPAQAKRFTAQPDATCTSASRALTTSCYGGDPLEGPSYMSCAVTTGGNVRMPPRVAASASTLVETTCTALDTPGGAYDPASGAILPSTMFAELMEIVE